MTEQKGDVIRFLSYGNPRDPHDQNVSVWDGDGFFVHDVPLGSSASFLDYDGVIIRGGTFDRVERGYNWAQVVCVNQADLDLREREFYTAIERGHATVILLPNVPKHLVYNEIDTRTDLFRRIVSSLQIDWDCRQHPCPIVDSVAPEFHDYISRFGAGRYSQKVCSS